MRACVRMRGLVYANVRACRAAQSLEAALFRDLGDTVAIEKEDVGRFIAANSPVRLTASELEALAVVRRLWR